MADIAAATTTAATTTAATTTADGRIPLLDLGDLRSGGGRAVERLAETIARTCEDTGFMLLANHGIEQALIDEVFAEASGFFDRDLAFKLHHKIGDLNIGYLPNGAQVVRTSTIHNNTRPNLSESFYIVQDVAADDPDVLAGKPFSAPNQWPAGMDGFRAATTAYFGQMQAMAHAMLPAFAVALGLRPNYFDEDFARPACTLRLIRYPAQPEPAADQFGFAPHIDTNFVTFLAQSKLPGLEVRTREGEWIRPPAIPGTFVVNTAEMLGRYSNDRFAPTPHRVVNASNALRHAIPFFYGPDNDAIIRVVDTCTGPGRPAQYEPILYSDHRRKLNNANFAHRQPAQVR
jgi:isopenicillin N synthase-like dioxygenase